MKRQARKWVYTKKIKTQHLCNILFLRVFVIFAEQEIRESIATGYYIGLPVHGNQNRLKVHRVLEINLTNNIFFNNFPPNKRSVKEQNII